MITIGIDNGVSGALVAISSFGGNFIAGIKMPVMKIGILNAIDGAAVLKWIKDVATGQSLLIAIEACPDHVPQASTMRSMGISFGILFGAISAALPLAKLRIVRSGNPKDSWQRAMLPGCKSGDTKPRALALAQKLWPDETFLATKRSKVPDSGLVDAALIAEFARTNRQAPEGPACKTRPPSA